MRCGNHQVGTLTWALPTSLPKRRAFPSLLAWTLRAAISLALAAIAMAGRAFPQSKPILLQPEVQYQRMDGFGVTLGNGAAREILELPEAEKAKLMDLLFGAEGTHFNLIRNEISWSARRLPMTHAMSLRGVPFAFAEDAEETRQFSLLREAQKRNQVSSYSCAWSPPPLWKSNLSETGGGELSAPHVEDFASYLETYLVFYKGLRFLEIPFLSFQNSPQSAAPFQSCLWSPEQTRNFLKLLVRQCQQKGLRTQFVLPELDWGSLLGYLDPILEDPEVRPAVSVVAAHSYTGDNKDRAKVKALSKKYSLKLWQTEFALSPAQEISGINEGLKLGRQILDDLIQAESQAWYYWVPLASPAWKDRLPLLERDGPSLKFTKRFWSLAQFSRFISRDSVRILANGGSSPVIAFRNPGYNGVVLVLLNEADQSVDETLQTRGWNLERITIYRTSKQEDCSLVPTAGESGSKVSLTLAPRSITTMVAQIRRLPSD